MFAFVATMVVGLVGATPLEIDDALREVLASGDYQTTLPTGSGAVEWPTSGNPSSSGGGGSGSGSDPGSSSSGSGAADRTTPKGSGTSPKAGRDAEEEPRTRWRDKSSTRKSPKTQTPRRSTGFGGTLVIALLSVLAGLALLGLVMAILQRLRKVDVRPVGTIRQVRAPPPAGVVVIEPPELSLIERLAAEGRYTEAIHELLRLALEAASTQLKVGLPREATSRELLSSLPFHESQRNALQRIVGAVERGHFGQRELDVEEFTACRRSFRVFEAGLTPRVGAS